MATSSNKIVVDEIAFEFRPKPGECFKYYIGFFNYLKDSPDITEELYIKVNNVEIPKPYKARKINFVLNHYRVDPVAMNKNLKLDQKKYRISSRTRSRAWLLIRFLRENPNLPGIKILSP